VFADIIKKNMCTSGWILEGIQSLQQERDLNIVSAAAHIPFFIPDDKKNDGG
jgi:hypothetical protein